MWKFCASKSLNNCFINYIISYENVLGVQMILQKEFAPIKSFGRLSVKVLADISI